MSGYVSFRAGLAAEEAVARHYTGQGHAIAATRWRGAGGEIDLILRQGEAIVFVEVKQSKSHAGAALHLTGPQIARIRGAAAQFLAGEPAGQDTEARFDVALVDAQGQIEILQNAFLD